MNNTKQDYQSEKNQPLVGVDLSTEDSHYQGFMEAYYYGLNEFLPFHVLEI
jgi:hypothetical protein